MSIWHLLRIIWIVRNKEIFVRMCDRNPYKNR